jgi:hypothetical protein
MWVVRHTTQRALCQVARTLSRSLNQTGCVGDPATRSRTRCRKAGVFARARLPLSTMLMMLVACPARTSDTIHQPQVVMWRAGGSGPLGSDDSTSASPCAGTKDDSDPVPFSIVDLGPNARGGFVPYAKGPEGRAVVSTSSEWKRIWDVLTDSIPLPSVNLRDSVVLLAATRVYPAGPIDLKFESVSRCRRRGDIVARLRVYAASAPRDYPSRSLSAVEIPRSELSGRTVRFARLFPDSVRP